MMKLTLNEKKENLLLKRLDVRGTLEFEGKTTPTNEEVAAALGRECNGVVVVKHIYNQFSHSGGLFEAVVYKDQQTKEAMEKKTKHQKKKEGDNSAAAGKEEKKGEK